MTAAASLGEVWIVGPGRMGMALGLAIEGSKGARKLTFLGRRAEAPDFPPPGLTNVGYAVLTEGDALHPPDAVLIAVPDTAIADVATQLASLRINPAVVLHTSGALGASVLAPLRAKGWHTGSLHPLVAAPTPEAGARKLQGAWFGIEGAEEAVAMAQAIVGLLGGRALRIGTDRKALYHAAAVMASNHVVALLDVAAGMMARCGVDPADAAAALGELARGAAEDVSLRGATQALTGPVLRGDVQTVHAHLDRLSGEESRLYSLLARKTLRIAIARGLSAQAAASIDAILSGDLD